MTEFALLQVKKKRDRLQLACFLPMATDKAREVLKAMQMRKIQTDVKFKAKKQ